MAVETTTQIVREDERLEAIKLNLLAEAAKLAYRPEFAGQLPSYQVAGFSPAQQAALQAGMQHIQLYKFSLESALTAQVSHSLTLSLTHSLTH